jgi:hypothetical protein
MNAITIYLVQKVISFTKIGLFLFGALKSAFDVPGWEPFVGAFGRCLFGWLFLYMLYRKKVFFKV